MAKENEPLKDTVILYHEKCLDGFGAAWAASRHFGERASYVAIGNNAPVPENQLAGREVYMLDYAAPIDVLRRLKPTLKRLVIIDHHKSNTDLLTFADESYFDLKHSGAVLSWQHFHPGTPTPRLLLHIEDMDIWRFELPRTKEAISSLGLAPFVFAEWDTLMDRFTEEESYRDILAEGGTIMRHVDKVVEELALEASEVLFEGYRVLMVNAPSRFVSLLGHRLAARQGPFAIIWHYREGRFKLSLRSDGSVDVSELAARYGGGGHPGAAGFILPQSDFLALLATATSKSVNRG